MVEPKPQHLNSSRHVTVKQIRTANKAEGKLDGVPLANVILVGTLSPGDCTVTTVRFSFSDGTGVIRMTRTFVVCRDIEDRSERVRREKDEHLDEKEEEVGSKLVFPWEQGRYYRVLGFMNFENDLVEVMRIEPLSDMNELTYHMIMCVHTHCKLTN